MKSNPGEEKLSVLIADDDRDIRQMLRIYLQRENYTVYEADNGQEVLTFLEHYVPNVLVLDLEMPVVNGALVCGAVRELRLPVSIMALTAYTGTNLKVRVLDAGADDYVTKPFVVEEFLARVRALVRRSAAAHDAPSG